MKQLSLTEARAKLSSLVAEVDRGKGPVAIAQRSKVKAVLVDPEWHSRVEEELAHYRRAAKQSSLKLRGSMKGRGADPARAAGLLLRIAAGDADRLTGRHLSVHDDLDRLLRRLPEVLEHDLYVLRPDRLRNPDA